MPESDLYRAIPLALSNGSVRLWRANAGMAWTGTVTARTPRHITLQNYRPIKLGPAGFSDLFGIQRVLITPEMVNRYIGAFIGIECKAPHGRTSEDQQSFLNMLDGLGAFQGIARSVEDARLILRLPSTGY